MTLVATLTAREQEIHRIVHLIEGLDNTDALIPHLNRYLAIQIAGYVEGMVRDVLLDYVEKNCNAKLKLYFERTYNRSMNVKWEKLVDLIRKFGNGWVELLKQRTTDNVKTSLDSIIDIRNPAAHGGSVTTSLSTLKAHFNNILQLQNVLLGVIGSE